DLVSADPSQPMRIRQNFLATDKDWATLRTGLRLVREVANQAPLRPFIASEAAPGTGKISDQEIDAHIRATGISVHHPLGTCKMGTESDNTAVVDGQLRVFGIDGLRVVDASVMPDLVGGNINAPVIMIAEKAADLIRGQVPPRIPLSGLKLAASPSRWRRSNRKKTSASTLPVSDAF